MHRFYYPSLLACAVWLGLIQMAIPSEATEVTKLTASDPSVNVFGGAVSLSGNLALVGAPRDNQTGTNAGAVYVFEFDGSEWSQQEKLMANDAANNDEFGVAVSLVGHRALIGAQNEGSRRHAGAAYIFEFDGTNWVQKAKLTAPGGNGTDEFGSAVSLSGDRALIGAFSDDELGTNVGAAFIFEFNGSTWVERAKLQANDASIADGFGTGVSLSGDRALIGAQYEDSGGSGSGAAYVFEFDGANWTQTDKLTADDAQSWDQFGSSVSLSGDRAVVGAFGEDEAGNHSGAAYVFDFDGAEWVQQEKLIPSGATGHDFFGWTGLEVLGDRIIVGAENHGASGAAYVYGFDGNVWSETIKLTSNTGVNGDEFGQSVSLSGENLLVGAPFDDEAGVNRGAAYVFTLPRNEPPVADAGEDRTVECAGHAGTEVTLDGTGSSDPDGDPLTFAWAAPGITFDDPSSATPAATFPLGTTTVTLTVADPSGESSTDQVDITVVDTTPPTVSVMATPASLWPPNHQYELITLTVSVSDICDTAPLISATAVSDEADNGKGDGNTTCDIEVTTAGGATVCSSNSTPQIAFDPVNDRLELRAERSGQGDGRVYTITVTAEDASGHTASSTATVTVPHSQGSGKVVATAPEFGTVSYPNPANPSTTIRYALSQSRPVTLKVYNMMGQEIRTLVDAFRGAGRYAVEWDGRDERGMAVSSGIYLYRLEAGSFSAVRKITLVR